MFNGPLCPSPCLERTHGQGKGNRIEQRRTKHQGSMLQNTRCTWAGHGHNVWVENKKEASPPPKKSRGLRERAVPGDFPTVVVSLLLA